MDKAFLKKNSPYDHLEYINFDSGDRLRIVPERGGLITEWKCNGKEILYFDLDRFNSKSKSVRGGIPVLFPICGDLPQDLLSLPQGDFVINQHGFARDLPWEISSLCEQKGVVMTLEDNPITRRSFPFLFLIQLEVRLEQNSLSIKTLVRNRGKETMIFSFGLHPYFMVENLENIAIRGLPETCINHLDMSIDSTSNQLTNLSKGIDFLASYKGSVSFTDLNTGASVEMQNQAPMDCSVFWTDPPRKMICMEPWTSPRSSLLTGDRTLNLEPGTSQELLCKFVCN